jgi:hypothetical protein
MRNERGVYRVGDWEYGKLEESEYEERKEGGAL